MFIRLVATLTLFSFQMQAATVRNNGFSIAHEVASNFTDPLCLAHQLYRTSHLVPILHPDASPCEKYLREKLLFARAALSAGVSLFTTPCGVAIRFFTSLLQNDPFLSYHCPEKEKELSSRHFSLLSWNVCCAPGGYSITDGGVLPWKSRLEGLAQAIIEADADVVCLSEVFDIQTAHALIDSLETRYAHFYYHMGSHALGPSSGLFVASKLATRCPRFLPFPVEFLEGRAKFCKKGVFCFEIESQGKTVAQILSTHLQHSEKPSEPTLNELEARKKEMDMIVEQMVVSEELVTILTGDLNLDENELGKSSWKGLFERGQVAAGFTWGGDVCSASFLGKSPSVACTLDYTLALKKRGLELHTTLIEDNFEAAAFHVDALSDHKALYSVFGF